MHVENMLILICMIKNRCKVGVVGKHNSGNLQITEWLGLKGILKIIWFQLHLVKDVKCVWGPHFFLVVSSLV